MRSTRRSPSIPSPLANFRIGKYPVTNEQYARFVAAAGHQPPVHWQGSTPPPELRSQPVVYVTWHDALAYCTWLGHARGEAVRLPTEAEWEKAARGTDGRIYPWGNEFDPEHCNMADTGIGGASPVGVFAQGASPYGVLDMAGNVWEWTQSLWGEKIEAPDYLYPYDPSDGREDTAAADRVLRVVRGGSFNFNRVSVHCAYRDGLNPDVRDWSDGFRVVVPGL